MNELLAKYQDVINTPPGAGDILTTINELPVVLTIQVEKGKLPFIYGRAYASETLDDSLGWYLRGSDDDRSVGWKCVLMTKARCEALKKCTVNEDKIYVKSLKVVRESSSGNSLLCEVHEYLPKEPSIPAPVLEGTLIPEETITIVNPDEDAS